MRFSGISLMGTLATCGSAAAASDDLDTIPINQNERDVLQSFVTGDGIVENAMTKGAQAQLQRIRRINLLKNGHAPVACVPPNAFATQDTQDWVGVLSCGVGEYCVESKASHLGGYCQQQELQQVLQHSRKLQNCWDPAAYCSGIEPYVEYCSDDDRILPTCGCGHFNATEGVGFISCHAPNYCIERRPTTNFAPCDPTCYNTFSNSTFSDSFVSTTMCVTFTEPYTQTFCRGYSQTFAKNGQVVDTNCNISLDGVYCNSCSVATFQGSPQKNALFFDAWNCTNLGLGASPNDGTFASRFEVDAPLLTGDPDCSKKDPPRPVGNLTSSPVPTPVSAVGGLSPVSLAFATNVPATSAAARFTLSKWGITLANVAATVVLGAMLSVSMK
jgi:hypothetical protein